MYEHLRVICIAIVFETNFSMLNLKINVTQATNGAFCTEFAYFQNGGQKYESEF